MMKKMKKILALVLSVCMLCSLPMFISGNDNMVYASSDFNVSGGVLYGYSGSAKDITIPDGVTSIGRNAFNMSTITSVTMPDTVETIEGRAFYMAFYLTSIKLSDNLKSIGDNAFYACANLTSITIPASVTSIDSTAFNGSQVKTIQGYTGSAAEAFANANSMAFVSLGAAPTPEPTEAPTPVPTAVPASYELEAVKNDDGTIKVTIVGNVGAESVDLGLIYDTSKVAVAKSVNSSGTETDRISLGGDFYSAWKANATSGVAMRFQKYPLPYDFVIGTFPSNKPYSFSGKIFITTFEVIGAGGDITFELCEKPLVYKEKAYADKGVATPIRPYIKDSEIVAKTTINVGGTATEEPTQTPATEVPTTEPTKTPVTEAPTTEPTKTPVTEAPTTEPTKIPATEAPTTDVPTNIPTVEPTQTPDDTTDGSLDVSGEALVGDVDDNKAVALKDAQLTLKYALGIENPTAEQKERADVNKSGDIELADAQMILKLALGIPVDLPKAVVKTEVAAVMLKKVLAL